MKADASEVLRLRKELTHARNHAADLQEELEEKNNLYIKAIQDRDSYKEKLNNVKDTVNRVDNIVQFQVNQILEKERKELTTLKEDKKLLLQRIEMLDQEKHANLTRERNQQEKILTLQKSLQELGKDKESRNFIEKIEIARNQMNAKDQEIGKLLKELNKKESELENMMAENRTLRSMANVPQNFGIDTEQIKFQDKEKIDDYKKLIRILQDDNYRLEEERAKLKNMLKHQSLLYKADQPQMRFKDLTKEQLFQLDQYILRLKSGDTTEPADYYVLREENKKLKAQLDVMNTQGFEHTRVQIELLLKQLGFGDTGKFQEQMLAGNQKLLEKILELLSKGNFGSFPSQPGSVVTNTFDFGPFKPPLPSIGVDGDITQGYTFKFKSYLDVLDRDGRAGLKDPTKYDVAFMQLQLCEFIELIKKKDDDLNYKNNEIEHLYKRIRDYLLVQDQLYKDFVKMEKDHDKKTKELEMKLRAAEEKYMQEELKFKKVQAALDVISTGNTDKIKERIIELTKQNAILDINLLRLTRKYQILEEQEELIRREYHNKEADMAEKDKYVQERINKLKEYKARAIQQLKFLFSKLRLAVPMTEYQTVQSENEILKQKNADYIDKNSQLSLKISHLQKQQREFLEADEKLQLMRESKEDLENEYEMLKQRLETVDQTFRWENSIFNKIVATLKRYKVSPQQAFEAFDKDKNGMVDKNEFLEGLSMLKVQDLSHQELQILMGSIDYDSSGHINYREFVRKLSRHGVKSRSKEEQIIYLIVDALKRSGIKSLSEAFELFDKKQTGTLSREDFKDIFKNMHLKLDENDIEKFIDNFWREKKAGIDYREFLRIFARYQVKLDQSAKQISYTRISDEALRTKKDLYMKIQRILKDNSKELKSLFTKMDADGSSEIEFPELYKMFMDMNLQISEADARAIFESIDFDQSGNVTFPEFKADFERTCENDITTLLFHERERVDENAKEQTQKKYNATGNQSQNQQINNMKIQMGPQQQMELQLQQKLASLEQKEKQLQKKLSTSLTILNHAQQSQIETQKMYDKLEKNWNDLVDQFHAEKQKTLNHEKEHQSCIKKEQADELQKTNFQLQTEVVETKAAMITYKNMTEVISDQARQLKLAMERKKDENENLVNAFRDMASQSEDQKRLGKLYYLIMLSRWQEAAINKKYDMVLTEIKELRRDLMNTEQLLHNKEYDHHEAENVVQEQQLRIEELRRKIDDSKNIFLTLDKAEFLNNIIREITDEKCELEESYFHIRSKYRSNQLKLDEAEAKAEYASEQLEFLQRSKLPDISERMIDLSNKLQNIRLLQMRAERESTEKKEENTYLSRLLRQQNDNVRKLEEKAAEYESRMHKEREEHRRADNERMKKFFNARFDNIPAAFGTDESLMISSRTKGFRDNLKSPVSNIMGINQINIEKAYTDSEMRQEPDHVRRLQSMQSNQSAQQDPKYLEGKLKKLEAQLRDALDEIRHKDQTIKKFSDWQISEKIFSEDEVYKDLIEKHRGSANQVHEQEAKEMADAAAQMVRSLQEMLDQKNEQIQKKDDVIKKLREQMIQQREKDHLEIAKLQNEMSLASNNALTSLREIVIKNQASTNMTIYGTSKHDHKTREELSRNLDEKDLLIHQLQSEIKGFQQQLGFQKQKNEQIVDQVRDLESELRHERQQVELKTKVRELENVKRELAKKDKYLDNLKNTINELNDKLLNLNVQKEENSEDKKMVKVQEGLKEKEHKEEIKNLQAKISMISGSRKAVEKDLTDEKLKHQELKEKFSKLAKDHEQIQKLYRDEQTRLQRQIMEKEKVSVELNQIKGRSQIGQGLGMSNGLSFEQLQARIKELENDVFLLNCSQKTVVVYNKENGCFEYIGEPIYLIKEREIADIDEFLASLKSWLNRNDRLTLRAVFESLDKENFGELSESNFDKAMLKLGIQLRAQEKKLIKDVLDPRKIGFIRYRSIVRELQGLPQIEFIPREVLKLAELVETRDLTQREFKLLLDPNQEESMNLTQLQDSAKHVVNEQFKMSSQEFENLFKHVTKSARTIGVVMSVHRLTEKVYTAVDALLIEKVKEAILRSNRSFNDNFNRHDSNKDGFLEYPELENMLLECQLAIKPNMLNRIYMILDNEKRMSKISFNSLKFMVNAENSQGGVGHSFAERSYDYHPTLDRVSLSEETTQEDLFICRTAARKILTHFQVSNNKSLRDILTERDKHNEGLIAKDEAMEQIKEARVSELNNAELNIIMRYADKLNRGYIVIDAFLEKLVELTVETKQEIMLRTFAMNVKRQGINLKQELFKYDTTRTGRLDKRTFQKAINQLPVQVNDEGVDHLFSAAESQDFRGTVDLKILLDKVTYALKQKPLPNFQPQQKTLAQSKVAKDAKSGGEAFQNWEAEKKYKTKLAALQQQIEESKKESQAAEKQAKHWQEVANKLEREKNGLQARLVDLNAKPPKAAKEESTSQAQTEMMQHLKDQVYYLQEENQKLQKNIQVELKAEIGRLQRDNEKLVERSRHSQDEAKRMEYQVNRLIGKPMDNIEKREEGELWRERRIQDLEKELQDAAQREHDLQEQLFKCEERLLDLKFQKETFDLQYARLQKRITDLEQYKLESSKYSAVLKNKEDIELKTIEENSNTLSNLTGVQPGSKKAQDTVKLRSKPSKSVAELEMLVESLKRVIEKQKSDNDALKKQIEAVDKHQDKVKSEKQLRQKIEALSQEVHSYEMRDVNVEEKDRTVKKLIEANRYLREDLKKESDRYSMLEGKYKDLLLKYNVLAKENAKNAELVFSMNTGANIHNYENHLMESDNKKSNKFGTAPDRDNSNGMKRGYNDYDRDFDRAY